MRPAIHGCSARINGHGNLGRAGRFVASRVTNSKRDCIDATITALLALGAQLDGLTIAGDHDVVQRVAAAVGVLCLIARHLCDDDIAYAECVTVVARTRHEVRNVERVITVIRRPHRGRVAIERQCRRLGVVHRDRLRTR